MTPPKPKAPRNPLPALIKQYYADLKDLAHQNVMYEMGTRTAFHNLLAGAGKPHKWTLIPELERKALGKTGAARTIRPDGTFKDEMNLVRGYWEAKDPGDDLATEIAKKRKAGYPFNNIIFEDNQTAILFQHDAEVLRADMKDPARLQELIVEFFRYTEPQIEEFEEAVEEFKERVPDLAKGLAKKIAEAHKTNAPFKQAFADFHDLCKTSLNPNLAAAAVDEMLIQHILTERLIREIFDNPEFVRRNVIAAEVEKVMLAMTSKSFDRNTYLKELDRFYLAIEHAARTMTEFADKQHFLNTVYERFFQGYSVKLADTMGIVYTPQAIVDFMCASVEEVLKAEFDKTLASDDVYIIDPCTGTGNFIVNLIRRIPKAKLEAVYKHRLFANEIMLLPYYIAALNIEHAYYEQTGTYESFEGLCFVDTLDMTADRQLPMFVQANTLRVKRQQDAKITIVIGNPPYNMAQESENDNNKNRKYDVIEKRIKQTYAKSSSATNVNKLSDPYVKFFRWAADRLQGRDGIVCFVSNNGFIDQTSFDGMRKELAEEFNLIYHVDLHGNVRRNTKLSGSTHNVFGIQVGVGVTLAVKRKEIKRPGLYHHRVPEVWRKEEKLGWLAEARAVSGVQWEQLRPDTANSWLDTEHSGEYAAFLPVASKIAKAESDSAAEAIFKTYAIGVVTNRDDVVYDFAATELVPRVKTFIEDYNAEVFRYQNAGAPDDVDSFVRYEKVKWSRDLKRDLRRGRYAKFDDANVRSALYRPFTKRWLFFDRILNQDITRWPHFLPRSGLKNIAIVVGGYGRKPFSVMLTEDIPDLNFYADPAQCFPFYVYDEDGSNRRENITDWALDQFRAHYEDPAISKWSIFDYVYALLHHPDYRTKFADNLKRELPRIPFAPNFRAFQQAGQKLIRLHLDYEKLDPYPLTFEETPGQPLSYRVEDKMRLSKDKSRLTVNNSLSLAGIPPRTFDYRLGNRSALDWVIDQYQLYTDPRSGITSDPNRPDDPQYIVRLVGQVIHVSLETVKIIEGLPKEYSAPGKGTLADNL